MAIIVETVLREQKEVIDKTCDVCGKSTRTEYGFNCMDIAVHWGFPSKHDLETWTAQICEDCVEEKLSFIKFEKHGRSGITAEAHML